jgi:hypothetical protein
MPPLLFSLGLHVQRYSSALQARAVVISTGDTAESDGAKIDGMATAQIIENSEVVGRVTSTAVFSNSP